MRSLTYLFLLFCASLISATVFADDAPVIPVQGGGVIPVHEEYIRLVSEQIDIYLESGQYTVNVSYTFNNEGPATSITMGFPNETDWMYGKSIGNFQAWVDDVPQQIYTKTYKTADKPRGLAVAPDLYYECFDTSFAPGQSRQVRNSYSQEYASDKDGIISHAKYILQTGAYWRGTISSVVVRVHHNLREIDTRARYAYFSARDLSGRPTLYNELTISPAPTGRIADGYEIVLTDIEPDFDIEITKPSRVIGYAVASSELRSSRYSYSPMNVLDNDLSTSWVEGVDGHGHSESILLYLSASTAGGKESGCYMISAIGMINGYAATQDLYYANSRVKSVTINYITEIEGAHDRGTLTWNLEETTDMQWLRLERSIPMSQLQFTIDDVYPGSKYSDTCIAEIVVVPEVLH